MSIAGIRVNTQDASELGGFDPVPADRYLTLITAQELKSDKGVTTIEVTFLIADGLYKGRKLFESICISAGGDAAKRIGFGMSILKALGKAFNFPDEWSDEMLRSLVSRKIFLTVEIEGARTDERTGKTYKPRNRIVKYESVESVAAQSAPNAPGGLGSTPGFTQQPVLAAPQNPTQPAVATPGMQQYALQAGLQANGVPAPSYNGQAAQMPASHTNPPQQYAQQPLAAQPAAPFAQPSFTPPPQQQFQQPAGYSGAPPVPAAPQPAPGAPSWMSGASA